MSVTEEIKSRLDIVNFVSQYVDLKKAGRNFKAPCPFHAERTPSFIVFPDSQTWRCFGACGEGGDIFSFAMKREGLDFSSTLRMLAEKAGVELHERTPEQATYDEKLDKLRGLVAEATRFFHNKLWERPYGDADGYVGLALNYARKRGLTDDTLGHFSIGYAPDDWRQTLGYLGSMGYDDDEIIEAGLAVRNEQNHIYDRFRNRLMIPIYDGRGLAIGFGARALDPEDEPKYLNSPQTPLFDKGAVLFGLQHARRAIRESETAVIVEGYMDAIQAHQAGFTNVVAQMGTALTEPQLKQLSRYARRLVLALDPDVAGIKATMRGLDVARQTLGGSELVFDPRGIMRQASKLGVEILVMTLPEGQDPDDLIRENPDDWRQLIESARSVADYVIAAGTSSLTDKSTFSDREQIAHQLLPILLATESDLQQHYNIQRLALKLRLDERVLIQWAQRRVPRGVTERKPPGKQAGKPVPEQSTQGPERETASSQPGNALERHCLSMLIRDPKLIYVANRRLSQLASQVPQAREALGPVSAEDFSRSDFRAVFGVLERALAQDDYEPVEYLRQHLPYELTLELDRLMIEPLEAFRQHLQPSLLAQFEAEIEATRKKREWATSASAQTELELIHKMLELRKQRLKRDNQDLFFLIQDVQNTDPQSESRYVYRSEANSKAMKVIEQTVNQVAQLQREH
jgi:DNA primase